MASLAPPRAVRTRFAPLSAADGSLQGAVAAVLALGAALYVSLGSRDFCLDDAWIHLAYAKSLRLGDGFAYNPGDRETGFSSPLWVVLAALTPILSSPVASLKVLGALCHATLAFVAARWTARLSVARDAQLQAWIAGLLVACDPLLVFAAGSGMEVSLTAALLIATLMFVETPAERGPSRMAAGAALGMACLWARPESLFLLGPYCALRFASSRDRRVLAPIAGAILALGFWMLYCLAVSGYPWPNTYYAKRHADLVVGLQYFAVRVLPAQGWTIGITGLVLALAAFVRNTPARVLAWSWLCAVIAVAASREVLINVLFYCSRYFAIFGAIPCVLVATQLPRKRSLALLVTAPMVLASALLVPQARSLQRLQENDIAVQHTEPALYLASVLPSDARVVVEGAGATRFFLPRSVRVIDMVGLNHRAAVHASTTTELLCALLHERPTHVLLPDGKIEFFERSLPLEPMRTFVDERTSVGIRSGVRRIHAARLRGIPPHLQRICKLP